MRVKKILVYPHDRPWYHHGAWEFKSQRYMEDNPRWRQLVPFILLRKGKSVLSHIKRGTDETSIGFSGHVEKADGGDGTLPLINRAVRIVNEQSSMWIRETDLILMGPIESKGNMFDRTHTGIVFRVDVGLKCPKPAAEATRFKWMNRENIRTDITDTWAKYCLEKEWI